jgi:hypothetical protein
MMEVFIFYIFRYKVKVNVVDGTGRAVFVLFDLDMYNLIDKKCAELFLDDKVSISFQLNVTGVFHIIANGILWPG